MRSLLLLQTYFSFSSVEVILIKILVSSCWFHTMEVSGILGLILKYNTWFYTKCNIKIHISLTGTMVPVSGSVKVALFCFLPPPLYPCPSPPLWGGMEQSVATVGSLTACGSSLYPRIWHHACQGSHAHLWRSPGTQIHTHSAQWVDYSI